MENTKAKSHCTFNLLEDVIVCALSCWAESNLRKAPCNGMVGMLDGVILYVGGAVKIQGDELCKASKSMAYLHIFTCTAVSWQQSEVIKLSLKVAQQE